MFEYETSQDCVPGGRPCRLADHAAWPSNAIAIPECPTIPDGRLFRLANRTDWPTKSSALSSINNRPYRLAD